MSGKKFASAAVAAALACLALASCAPKARAAVVPYDYASWRKTTEVRLDYPVPGHEDRYRVIYMNERGFSAAPGAGGRLEFPVGTIIAKEVFAASKPGPDDKPIMITAMVKAPDDPDARGGWLWVAKNLATGAENVSAGDFCARCHSNANEKHPYGDKNAGGAFSDYVFFVPESMRPAPASEPAAGMPSPGSGEAAGQAPAGSEPQPGAAGDASVSAAVPAAEPTVSGAPASAGP